MNSLGSGDRLKRLLVKRMYEDKRRFELSIPREYRRLRELLEDPAPSVTLASGDIHVFDREELEALAEDTPWYLHGFIKLPWVFSYRRVGFTRVYRLEGPDRWAARTLHYIFEGSIAGELWEIDAWRFPKLLRRYKSLILVILRISMMGDESSV
jgi:uncharacterized protein (UPF0216 family)